MGALNQELTNELEWRIAEIATIKTTPLHPAISETRRKVLEKHAIPAIYSLWEGYVVAIINILIVHINNENIHYRDISTSIITHDIYKQLKLSKVCTDPDKKIKLVTALHKYMGNSLKQIACLHHVGTLNLEDTNKLFSIFKIEHLSTDKYQSQLNKLLMIRNNIAHGEHSRSVTREVIDELSFVVEGAMSDALLHITECIENKSYLQNSFSSRSSN